MKKILLVLLLLCLQALSAQSFNRTLISGQINVPEKEDPEGIVVYNVTASQGTITNVTGTFFLNVKLSDEVVIQSVQFAPVTITIDRGIIESKKMNVTLRENVTQLNEIVVSPSSLTGNINVDVQRLPVQDMQRDSLINFSPYVAGMYADAGPHKNVALDDETWRYGLNFVNLFKALIGKRDADKSQFATTAKDDLTEMYSNAFFKKNLDIKEENIGLFIDYVSAQGLNENMLRKGNELNLIQFLLKERDDFKEQMSKE